MTLVAGKRRSLLMAGDRDDDKVFMTRSLNVMPKTTEQHLIVRGGKSVAEVVNNKRLRSRYYTVEPNNKASRGLSATAEPLVYSHNCE